MGGGLYCTSSDAKICNNVINNNLRGGVVLSVSNPLIINNTIYGNDGHGIFCIDESYPIITNSIIWGNTLTAIDTGGFSSPECSYNDLEGDWNGPGNIDVEPLFRDPENGDFHLMVDYCGDPHNSPCIDAGDPVLADSLLDCDWGLGNIRSDMGAYGGGDSITVYINEEETIIPRQIILRQNYPNPFNPTAVIRYSIPSTSIVKLNIYNLLGQKVETLVDCRQPAGYYSVIWDATDFSSGIYFYKLSVGRVHKTKQLTLIK